MFNTNDFWFWVIVIGSLALNVVGYYFRARKVSARQKTFLKIGAGVVQALIFAFLLMVNFPVTHHYYDAEETEAKENGRLFKLQDENITQIDADLRQIQTALLGIVFSLAFTSVITRTELSGWNKEKEAEEPIVLGLNNK